MLSGDSLRTEIERRAAEETGTETQDPRRATQWTPAVVSAMVTSVLATVATIVGLVVNRPPPPPSMAGVASTRDVDAVELRAADAARSAAEARDHLRACRSQLRGLDERVKSLENPKGSP